MSINVLYCTDAETVVREFENTQYLVDVTRDDIDVGSERTER